MSNTFRYQDELENNFRIAHLIGHFIQENLTGEEELELDKWIQQSEHNMEIFENLTDEASVKSFMKWYHERDTERRLLEVKQRLPFRRDTRMILMRRIAIAASILGILLTAGYFLGIFDRKASPEQVVTVQPDIQPGHPMATLTLADGRKINLGTVKDTVINSEVSIVNGTVVYQSAHASPEFHEIVIPRKGFYQVLLPDGSRAWINAESSIRYPSRFTGKERRVEVTGETFFEVAKDSEHPFVVSANGIEITALGTAFNVNAYPEEQGIKATLTHGSIKVSGGAKELILTPGQQLGITSDGWAVTSMDTKPVIAWTRNQFRMKNNTIEEVMRMIERWYDAKVTYKARITDHFTGTIDRNVPVSQVLKLLEATGEVHFQIKDNEIIVSK